MDNWLHLLQAAAADDREACIKWSLKVGYLTGQEDEVKVFRTHSPHLAHTSICPAYARRTRAEHDSPRSAFQALDTSAVLIRTWLVLGRHHRAHPGPDPRDASAQADAPAEGDV